mmetsp:Transcript_32283/g.84461  ORF Transcript_32283/g.84461 Transcript_32283/m.84461 type:complete len:257 (-) Transcript_32283:526-1296(-)
MSRAANRGGKTIPNLTDRDGGGLIERHERRDKVGNRVKNEGGPHQVAHQGGVVGKRRCDHLLHRLEERQNRLLDKICLGREAGQEAHRFQPRPIRLVRRPTPFVEPGERTFRLGDIAGRIVLLDEAREGGHLIVGPRGAPKRRHVHLPEQRRHFFHGCADCGCRDVIDLVLKKLVHRKDKLLHLSLHPHALRERPLPLPLGDGHVEVGLQPLLHHCQVVNPGERGGEPPDRVPTSIPCRRRFAAAVPAVRHHSSFG